MAKTATDNTKRIRDDIMRSLEKNLPRYRIWAGMSQAALSSASGVAPARISDFEGGRDCPSPETIKKLADAMGCTVRDLIQFSESLPKTATIRV